MTLSDAQWSFLCDLCTMICWARENHWKLTGGELKRTTYQQEKYFKDHKSKTLASKHLDSLAFDFQGIWPPDMQSPSEDLNAIRPLGEFWKSLNDHNVWGGDWGWDNNHFERSFP